MLSRAELKRLRALARPRGRAGTGLFVAAGVRLAEDTLNSPVVLRVALVAASLEDTERGRRLAAALRERVRTETVTEAELQSVAATETPQGVVVVAEIPRRSLDDVVVGERSLVVVLDAVQDPGNFGTIVRSADAFGAACVIALPGTVDPWNPKSVRSAMGSSLRVPVVESTWTESVAWLRPRGFRVLGADMTGQPVDALPPGPRTAVVLGNEGAGLSDVVRAALDATVSIPLRGHAESLNVGVAAGILLYLLSRETLA